MKHLRTLGLALAAVFYASVGWGASVPLQTGPQDLSQFQATLNAFTQSMNASVPGFGSLFAGKNYLDNGDMFVAQRGTAEKTGASTAGCAVLSYVADRWCVDTNVTSGAGFGIVATATPTPPPGFQNEIRFYRKTGALLQPVQLMQEIESSRFTQLQGKVVIGSCYVQPLAGFTATAPITMNLITGTGADEGMGALRSAVGMTASPAITPALTGVATTAMPAGVGSPSFTLGTTAVWSRIYSAPVVVPATATEGIFALGFTPVGTASGTTDGIAVTGCQLEQVDPNQTAASSFEALPPQLSLARAQRIYHERDETAAITPIAPCAAIDTTHTNCLYQFPQVMAIVPIMSYATGFASPTTTSQATLGACTTGPVTAVTVTSTAANTQSVLVTCTAGTIPAAGVASWLYSNNGTGKIIASADF